MSPSQDHSVNLRERERGREGEREGGGEGEKERERGGERKRGWGRCTRTCVSTKSDK